MNIPMKLTVLRIVLTPVFLVVFFLPVWLEGLVAGATIVVLSGISAWFLLVLYVVCELSDFLDGFIARRYNMVTDLGKVLDPFSDVLIHITYFLCFLFVGIMPVLAFAIILYREFGILMVRMLSMKKGIAVPANWWGKGKTVLYGISGLVGLLFVVVDRICWNGAFSLGAGGVFGLDGATGVDGGAVVGKAGMDVQGAVASWGLPALQGLFWLSAVVSLISFLTYLIPFLRMNKKG